MLCAVLSALPVVPHGLQCVGLLVCNSLGREAVRSAGEAFRLTSASPKQILLKETEIMPLETLEMKSRPRVLGTQQEGIVL